MIYWSTDWSDHNSNVIMGAIASQITSLTIVYSTVYSGPDQRKHQSSASLAFVRGIHRWPVNSPHKSPVTQKCFHLMTSSWKLVVLQLMRRPWCEGQGHTCETFYTLDATIKRKVRGFFSCLSHIFVFNWRSLTHANHFVHENFPRVCNNNDSNSCNI